MSGGIPPIILILGYGPNIGHSVAVRFGGLGYKVAIASRSLEDEVYSKEGWLQVNIDLSKPESVPAVFSKVEKQLGIPSVVVYNGAVRTVLPETDIFSAANFPDIERIKHEFNINTISGLIAAQQAVQGFKQLPSSLSRTFIFTANALNEIMLPFVPTFGMSKKGISYMIEAASVSYRDAGFSFYYTDERHIEGPPVLDGWDGQSRAELYIKLVTEKPKPFQQTFVKGHGYVDFREQDFKERIARMDL